MAQLALAWELLNSQLNLNFDNTYQRDLDGFYTSWHGVTAPAPQTIKLNPSLAGELGLDLSNLGDVESAEIFSGTKMLPGAAPIVQAYAGHQFGGFTPQLGDGRALLLGEIIDSNGHRRDIQLKGSGRTPFSRGGDGKSALGPVLREYIVSEAMHALGVPTTRALAAVTTGENVMREIPLPGAVLTRVAASHIRVGTFEFFSARKETDKVQQLADYAIARHYPHLLDDTDRYIGFLEAVSHAQAALVSKWMLIGFIHGVMNTDNTTISGETIDYGPCAFMDAYDPATVFSSIDTQGRYQYQNQPSIAVWNLSRLAETLVPLIDPDQDRGVEKATEVLNGFSETYFSFWLSGIRKKLGLTTEKEGDIGLASELFKTIEGQNVDFTLLFRSLADVLSDQRSTVNSLFKEPGTLDPWLEKWQARLGEEDVTIAARTANMNQQNPIYIPRNHNVEKALSAATINQDYSVFETLLDVLTSPFEKRDGLEAFEQPAPVTFGPYQTYCGT